jgi:DNA polymerase-3 subunit alpha
MFLIFDTETTGLPKNYKAPVSDSDNWPRMVQLAWQLHDVDGKLITAKNFIVKPNGFDIPIGVSNIHGITTERALRGWARFKCCIKRVFIRCKANYLCSRTQCRI